MDVPFSILGILEKLFLLGIGLAVAVGALWLVYYRSAHYWRRLAVDYGAPWRRPLAVRHMQSAVAYGDGVASTSFNGMLTIGIHDTGISLRVLPPYSFFQEPLFIPFSEITGWEQIWYVNAKSVELAFRHVPEVKLVMPASQIQWIKEYAAEELAVIDHPSPHRQRPNVWYMIIVAQGVAAVGLAVYFFANL